jgi:hypothetical protein
MDYSRYIVDKIKSMGESQTIAISEKAKQLKKHPITSKKRPSRPFARGIRNILPLPASMSLKVPYVQN